MRWVSFCLFASTVLYAADDPFAIELSVRAENQQQTARGRSTATPATRANRPVLTAKAKTKLRIRWSVLNAETTGTIPDVTVHMLLDTQDAIGQREAPAPSPDAVYESALVMDFAAHAKSSADFTLETPEPGSYLLRVETIGAARTRRDEYVASMDLKVLP